MRARGLVGLLGLLSLFACGPTGSSEVRGERAKPQRATTGTVRGEVRWNGRGVPDNEVMLCEDLDNALLARGCAGRQYTTRTDAEGAYVFEEVQPSHYILAVRVFETDEYQYMARIFEPEKFFVGSGDDVKMPVRTLFKDDMVTTAPTFGERVTSDELTLSWAPYPDAARYTVTLRASGEHSPLQELQSSEPSVKTTLPDSACEGCSYTWTVEAFNTKGAKIAETGTESKFSVGKRAEEEPAAGTLDESP